MKGETKIQNNIRTTISDVNTRAFRNDNGVGYGYDVIKSMLEYVKRQNPQLCRTIKIMIQKGYIKYGAGVGFHDLFGVKKITITQDMVGKEIGQFFTIEVKEPGHKTDKELLKKQQNIETVVKSMGGLSGFAESPEEALSILNERIT